MTERLYYADPYCREFDAAITRIDRRHGEPRVALDRTAFYPTSGGQPFDVGVLSGGVQGPGLPVIDVFDEDDGTVVHVVEEPGAPVLVVGQAVHGTVDWARRFDHMQQHSGQHVLSAAFDRQFDVRTLSFHLGTVSSTIDLSREVSRAEVAAAEREANRIVWENRAVTIRFASAEEAASLPLRKEPARAGTLRLIDIDGFDLSACGGTHVASTGSIGVIAIGAVERFKGGERVEFFCGGRALARFQSMQVTLSSAVRLLSVVPDDVPGAIERLQTDARGSERARKALEQDLVRYRAAELAAEPEQTPAGPLICRAIAADASELKSLATAIVATSGTTTVLVSMARPVVVVVARSQNGRVAANQVLAALITRFGGRGGGRPELAQAGGLEGSPDDVLAAARAAISGGKC